MCKMCFCKVRRRRVFMTTKHFESFLHGSVPHEHLFIYKLILEYILIFIVLEYLWSEWIKEKCLTNICFQLFNLQYK